MQREFLGRVTFDAELVAAFDAIPGVLCFVKNRAGQTMYSSAHWASRHGFRLPEQMLLKTDADLTPGSLAEAYLADDRQVYATGLPLVGKVEICLDEVGLPDWHITSKFPLRDRQGEIIGILGISRACLGHAPAASPSARIAPAARMLREDLTRYPSAGSLAKACGLSVRQLQRRFVVALGISPREYWMKCRIRAACESIRKGDEKLGALSARLGFCDQSSFTAQFRRHTGVTPSAYGKRLAELAA